MAPTILNIHGFRHRSRVAAFDFDWTLVKPKERRRFPKNVDDWEWLFPTIPYIIKEWYDKGWAIVIFTNQTKEWKVEQIRNVLSTLDIPVLAVIAMNKEEHKPSLHMWDATMHSFKVKKETSFFVGDAMGRKGDWSDTDKLFADAIGISAITPEAFFGKM